MGSPRPRRSGVAALLLAAGVVALLATFVHAGARQAALSGAQVLRAEQVEALLLTDLSLFTEARYTRHPSQADLHTPFQSHPQSLDHFPSGSILGPPPTLIGRHGQLAQPATLSR